MTTYEEIFRRYVFSKIREALSGQTEKVSLAEFEEAFGDESTDTDWPGEVSEDEFFGRV
jgi:hypothetical protein